MVDKQQNSVFWWIPQSPQGAFFIISKNLLTFSFYKTENPSSAKFYHNRSINYFFRNFAPPPRGPFWEFQKIDIRFGFRRPKNHIVPNFIKIGWVTKKKIGELPLPPPKDPFFRISKIDFIFGFGRASNHLLSNFIKIG